MSAFPRAIRFLWLAIVVVAIAAHPGRAAVTVPLLVVAIVAFGAWVAWSKRPALAAVAVAVLAVAAGALTVWSSSGIGLLAAAGVAAGATFPVEVAAFVAAPGAAALVIASAAHGWAGGLVTAGIAAIVAGVLGGAGRREMQSRTEQDARVRLAREVHDVLAHTLGALAVQLEAAELVRARGDDAKLEELLGRSRALVSNGLEEVAAAVNALRNEPVVLADRLANLVASDGTELRVEGTPRPLPAEAGLALYRAAQEALTNARKHAPGAPTEVVLTFGERETTVRVVNGVATAAPRSVGAGLGLQGMRERLELAGGRLDAGRSDDGWSVQAVVPA